MQLFLLLLLALITPRGSSSSTTSPASTLPLLHEHFGSKSPYPAPPADNCATVTRNYTALFLLSRHGARFPTKKHLAKYELLKAKVPALVNWTHEFEMLNEGLLTERGKADMRALGEEVRTSFPLLFPANYHPRLHEIRASKITRTLQSASAFALGLFGGNESFAIESESLDADDLLRFHENCAAYQRGKKSQTPHQALARILLPLVQRVRQRLVDNHAQPQSEAETFNQKELEALWSACMFQGSLLPGSACKFFTKEDAIVLEYVNDVRDYWEKGLGQELNYKMACRLLQHAVDSLQAGKLRFLFGHAETIMPVMAALGYFPDEDKTVYHAGEGSESKWPARAWRSGRISPFGANLSLALYVNELGETCVQIKHNGVELDLTRLCGKRECAWDAFKASLEARMGQCDLSRLCK